MASRTRIKIRIILYIKEFAKLLDQDLKDRKLIENQIIKAKVVEILKSYIVCDAKAKIRSDDTFSRIYRRR